MEHAAKITTQFVRSNVDGWSDVGSDFNDEYISIGPGVMLVLSQLARLPQRRTPIRREVKAIDDCC